MDSDTEEWLLVRADVKSVEEKEVILIEKLKQCEMLCDFVSPNADPILIEEKRKVLLEIIDYISTNLGVLTSRVNEALISTVSINIFRPIYVANCERGFDPEEDIPQPEPSWSHLKIVYEILRRFVISSDTDSKQLRTYITPAFIRSLVELFSSNDMREREILKVIVHRIYGKVMSLRPLIRKSIQHRFSLFTYQSHHHNGIPELLEIMGSIINGFAVPLKDEHIKFLKRSLMPLHTSQWLKLYHVQLSFCVTQFIEKSPTLSRYVIKTMLKHWPVTPSRMQVMFLDELEAVLEVTRPDLFKSILRPLWTRLAHCIESPHFLVAERVLLFWKNDYIVDLIMVNREEIIPLVYTSLKDNIEGHWNPNVLNLSEQVREMLSTMDEVLCAKCDLDYAEAKRRKAKQET